ncbi:hypothetical protein [Komagataeibacter diospyri]|uniref:Uncharacterized protein n=1 Tax=Komagataeibacter diospyri TaxID=1932662 RepID=A0A4P5NTM2_9PROT|nr:hypothetical protein [Komagataeibacter diospyri]GCE85120.1 hypothetical protein MSKU9_3261 [Komagataeibacter diospyri]
MCSSENELIHDARQVHLEELIMKNEEQFVMVRLPLSDEQHDTFYRLTRRDSAEAALIAISAPIPPCADVETVGWGRETSFVDIKAPGCHAVSIHKEWDGGIPLVRRTDMEAQVAKVAAEKDAEIARLSAVLLEIVRAEPSIYDGRYLREIARTALNEGSVVGEKA